MMALTKIASVLLASLLAVGTAQATVITYNFTATVQSMFEHDGATGVNTTVNSSVMPGVLFANGDTMHGRFTYDTDTALSPYYQAPVPSQGTYQLYADSQRQNSADVTFDRTGFTLPSSPISSIQVADDASTFSGWDIFYAGAGAIFPSGSYQGLTIDLFDSSGKVFANSALPDLLPLAGFSYANVDFAWLRISDGGQMHASGAITSLSLAEPTSVPEPDAFLMLLTGLAITSFLTRRETAASRRG